MGLFEGFVVYISLWWVVLFMTLPFGADPEKKPQKGHAESAPARPNLLKKFLVTSLIALLLWLVIFAIITFELVSLS